MTFTIEEIRIYLKSQDSFGDALYNLSEENIQKANKQKDDEFDDGDKFIINAYSKILD